MDPQTLEKYMHHGIIILLVGLFLAMLTLNFFDKYQLGVYDISDISGAAVVDTGVTPADPELILFMAYDPTSSLGTHISKWDDATYSYAITYEGSKTFDDPHACYYDGEDALNAVIYSYKDYNSHVATAYTAGVTSPVCYGGLDCTYTSSDCSTLGSDYTCYGSVSGTSNAHYAECGTYATNICCKEGECSNVMQCGEYIDNLSGGPDVPFEQCTDVLDPTPATCSFCGLCVYEGSCYGEDDTADINGMTMICSAEHWCPDLYYYDTGSNTCKPKQDACYSATQSTYCNYEYAGTSDMNWWNDLTGTNPCIREDLEYVIDGDTSSYNETCCEVVVYDYDDQYLSAFYYQNIPYVSNAGNTLASINVCGDDYVVGTADGICPADYANCMELAAYDEDCCNSACGWECMSDGNDPPETTVCGDNSLEFVQNEKDSEGDLASDAGAEDCYGTCSTEEVIDDSNTPVCLTDTTQCVDDGVAYTSFDQTGNVCVLGTSCRDADDTNGDYEVCDNGNWHDPDESETYCEAGGYTWGIGAASDNFQDDFDGDATNGYCTNEDGYAVELGFVEEIVKGSSLCQKSFDATVTFKDVATQEVKYEFTITNDGSWGSIVSCLDGDPTNKVGYLNTDIIPGEYYLVIEKTPYTTTTERITITNAAGQSYLYHLYLSSECQPDCTRNDNVCHADCSGVNGCTYYATPNNAGETVAQLCDGITKGYYVDYETDEQVLCCVGTPGSSVRPPAGEVGTGACETPIWIENKPIIMRGESVKLFFAVFNLNDCE